MTIARERERLAHDDADASKVLRVGIVGLGYVGSSLAEAFVAVGHAVRGFDVDPDRRHAARARVRARARARGASGRFASVATAAGLDGCDVFIIAVPTPTIDGRPELRFVRDASRSVGAAIGPGALVVVESTVAPGTTRTLCLPILEAASGMTAGTDFLLAFSPERVNPGDALHSVRSVVKVVAGYDSASAQAAAALYGQIAPVHLAPSLEVAELAKLVENTQRDVNIALMNEVARLCGALGMDWSDVLDAARTKWNFADFSPGLVGGHCIAEDPYYLLAAARSNGVALPTVAAARETNATRAEDIADAVASVQPDPAGGPVLIHGRTYKADVADTRNAGAEQLRAALARRGFAVVIADPLTDDPLEYETTLAALRAAPVEVALVTVVHRDERGSLEAELLNSVREHGTIIDLTGLLSAARLPGLLLRHDG